jgi:hypothetical protein
MAAWYATEVSQRMGMERKILEGDALEVVRSYTEGRDMERKLWYGGGRS